MKLGHYTRIPPRTLFAVQMVASIWACFVSLGVLDWQSEHFRTDCGCTTHFRSATLAVSNIEGLCTAGQGATTVSLTCPRAGEADASVCYSQRFYLLKLLGHGEQCRAVWRHRYVPWSPPATPV